MATADDQMGQKSEPTRDPVNVTLPKCGRNFQKIMGRVHETTKCDYPTILVYAVTRGAGRSSRVFFGVHDKISCFTEFLFCWSLEEQNELTF